MPTLLPPTPVVLDPGNPAIATPAPTVPPGTTPGFRPNINTSIVALDTKIQSVEAFLEAFVAVFGDGIISGGGTAAGSGFAVTVGAYMAIVGNIIGSSTAQTVGGFAASTVNTLYLRQDGTWYVPPLGATTPPLATDGHGGYMLWGTVTTDTGSVTAISILARTFEQQRGHVLIAAADPANNGPGDVWYNSTGNQLCVNVAGTILRSGAFS